ncbi:MAG: hypothetical protein Q8R00_05205 [Candidatus Nanoarchaeia archaeon]|nr:hypothetical protein [Candidatus Nanoarchaeia archaeon]
MEEPVFMDSAHYQPKRDGTLAEYLKTHNGISCFPLFRGYSWYKELWKKEYLMPGSIIRLMWNVGRGDEHFLVLEKDKLQGIGQGTGHGGREGIHHPKEILTNKGPQWEAHRLNFRKIKEDLEEKIG